MFPFKHFPFSLSGIPSHFIDFFVFLPLKPIFGKSYPTP